VNVGEEKTTLVYSLKWRDAAEIVSLSNSDILAVVKASIHVVAEKEAAFIRFKLNTELLEEKLQNERIAPEEFPECVEDVYHLGDSIIPFKLQYTRLDITRESCVVSQHVKPSTARITFRK
jgi:hypothetical protein